MRTIRLYISGKLADISDAALILFNWTQEDLANPTAVKNSYTQQVTLPGTPANDLIFGNFFRMDRKTASGEFSANVRTPFMLMGETGEVLESGYLKLDGVAQGKGGHSYKVTLFGGLGSLLYGLTYDANGDKLSLADMTYTPGGDSHEFDLKVSRDLIKTAWQSLASWSEGDAISSWEDVLNFAPCYNGVPSEGFDAGKAYFYPALMGLPTTVDGNTVRADGGSLATLPMECTEWDVKDLRSYLQRGVFRVRAFFEALAAFTGRTVTLDPDFFNTSNPYYERAWVTLPVIQTLNNGGQEGSGPLSFTSAAIGGADTELQTVTPTIPSNTEATATVKIQLLIESAGTPSRVALRGGAGDDEYTFCFVQLLAYSGGMLIGGSTVHVFSDSTTPAAAAALVGYTPVWARSGYAPHQDDAGDIPYDSGKGGWCTVPQMELSASGLNATGFSLRITFAKYNRAGNVFQVWDAEDEESPITFNDYKVIFEGEVAWKPYKGIRSFGTITKEMLLGGAGTPADFLLSYCKRFGLLIICDKDTDAVRIVTRDTFFGTGLDVLDLTDRVDTSQAVDVKPFVFDSRWYVMKDELDEDAAFVGEYNEITGRDYGAQRINTGYPFDMADKVLIEGNAFKGGAEVNERGNANYNVTRGSYPWPTPLLSGPGKYALYGADGKPTEYELPAPPNTALVEPHNIVYKGYANRGLLQLHDKDGGAIDTRGTLVFFRGPVTDVKALGRVTVTDDDAEMVDASGGTPCWRLNDYLTNPSYIVDGWLPSFGRYLFSGTAVERSMDFGTPSVIDMPGVTHPTGKDIYSRAWAAYIADRYDKDTRIMTCRVDFRGLQVGAELLSRFWYYRGALWVLNKINNYSVTQAAPVKCEFVRVMDANAYTAGQNF